MRARALQAARSLGLMCSLSSQRPRALRCAGIWLGKAWQGEANRRADAPVESARLPFGCERRGNLTGMSSALWRRTRLTAELTLASV